MAIPIDDVGFVWGATVTDRVRTYNGKLFRLADHLVRFRHSCELCRIPQPVSDAELSAIAEGLIELNRSNAGENADLVLVMFATPGTDRGKATLGMHTVPLSGDAYRHLIQNGASLVTPSIRHLPKECVPPAAKMRSRMFWWMAEQEVRAGDPQSHALLLDENGTVTETSSANFAIVRHGSVCTPPTATVLAGISLRVVDELCSQLGLTFIETPLRPEDCYTAEEALLTSTVYGIAGVSRINGRAIPFPGPVLERLHDAWSVMVGQDIWRSILPDR
jgi:D-alanine transaminase/branched-chain amino acid aminotransferase